VITDVRRLAADGARVAAVVGVTELVLARRGRSLLDTMGKVVVDRAPIPVIELGVRLLGTTDKPLLRLQMLSTIVGAGALVSARAGAQPASPRRTATLVAIGAASLVAADRSLAARRPETRPAIAQASTSLSPAYDGVDWPEAAELVTPVDEFYVTDVVMRPPVIHQADWRLEVVDAQGGRAMVDVDLLAGLERRERDSVLACVHNRPGWDRLGFQRWTGVAVPHLLEHLGLEVPDADAELDLVMEGADGLVMTLPWREAVSRDSWLITGMGGRPLTAAHGHPARIMTRGLPGQYSGPKWVTALRLVPTGTVAATWVARGWPRGPVVVPLMARIDHPGSVGMPPRLPAGRVRVPPRTAATGVAWAPAHGGVAGVDLRVDDGDWISADLAADLGEDAWRRWRVELELAPGDHDLSVRCRAHDGTVQAGTGRPPFPQGADGFHRVRITVGP
jgi:DMSO/TMAO reductase YedYZ molybdopterin-dependent catalytic subunit